MQHKRENDPERIRGSRDEASRPQDERRPEDIRNREDLDEREDDLGRAQSEGNLGNERTRDTTRNAGRMPHA